MTFITETIKRRLNKLAPICREHNHRPEIMDAEQREDLSLMFASTFTDFKAFAELGMAYLGFKLSEIQADIADYMQNGFKLRMVQAQRGEAKSTLAALYCIWLLIKDPSYRVLVVSGGEKQASDVALLIIRIIENWYLLCWLRPDVSKGDRSSVSAFDVHYSLKGIDKTASVACVGITANLQGFRADFILADDVETQKNSTTQIMRETLVLLTKEFSAICIKGEIMYLGTPQTKDSVYRTLPQRGFDVRVWTGRYPTDKELERYGAGVTIAPLIMERLRADPTLQTGGGIDGTRGQPTDPAHIGEETLQAKELDYGDEGFALQYMLDTTLSDAMRTKIKLSDCIVLACSAHEVPENMHYLADPKKLLTKEQNSPATSTFRMYNAAGVSDIFVPFQTKIMVIDPAGSGGDEIAFAAGGATNSFIFLLSTGGFAGGTTFENVHKIILKMFELDITILDIEKNMGHGVVHSLFLAHIEKLQNIIKRYYQASPEEQKLINDVTVLTGLTHQQVGSKLSTFGLSDYYVTTQKEKRIIDTISPITRRHKLVVSTKAIEDDWEYCMQHPSEKRLQYSCFQQLGNITLDRNSLVHDDRADCVQRLVERLSPFLARDEVKAEQERAEEVVNQFLKNPMGYSQRVLNSFGNRGRRKRR